MVIPTLTVMLRRVNTVLTSRCFVIVFHAMTTISNSLVQFIPPRVVVHRIIDL